MDTFVINLVLWVEWTFNWGYEGIDLSGVYIP